MLHNSLCDIVCSFFSSIKGLDDKQRMENILNSVFLFMGKQQ